MNDLARLAESLRLAAKFAVIETAYAARARAVELSSGPHSYADLAALGHPYALRHGSPKLDPNVVNVQSGQFRAAWEVTGPTEQGDAIVAALQNTAPHADDLAEGLVDGRRLMFPRRPDLQVESELAGELERRLASELEGMLR